jgi:all-trans-8'-apo-beta-carotenal 15,15'-oxygenase
MTEPLLAPSSSPAAAPMPDFAPGIEKAFTPQTEEWEERPECVAGEVPDFVRGTYYVNGPARFKVGDLDYRHWLDGDGMIARLQFHADGISFKNRYIQSTKFTAEQKAGRALFRTFGTPLADGRLNRFNTGLQSPVNISVYPHGGRILAFGEQGLPWELNPETLETLGQFTFDNRLNDASPFAAHPKFDTRTGEMFNFGVWFSAEPKLYFYCLDRDGLRYRKAISLPYSCSVHDFALSKHYAVFYLSPYLLDMQKFLQHGCTLMDSLHWEPDRGSRLLVLDRRTGELVASLHAGERYCLHLINAFEQQGRLIVDLLEFDNPIYAQYQPVPDLFRDVGSGGPVRFVVDLRERRIADRITFNYSQAPDLPSMDPRQQMQPNDDFWMLGISSTGNQGRKFFDELVHASWSRSHPLDIYRCPRQCYLAGEPVFVGRPQSAEGVVICQEFDAREERSSFLLFDAHNVSQCPKSRIALQKKLHLGFHACFVQASSNSVYLG